METFKRLVFTRNFAKLLSRKF